MAKPGRPKNPPSHREVLKSIVPIDDIFEEDEVKIYESLIDVYLKDFDEGDLTSSDMDDIMSMAMNRVLEIRLLRSSKGNAEKHLDISAAIEKLRKQTEKIKENLSSRRRDRINPNEFKGFSIVDLAVAFDADRKKVLEEKDRRLREEDAAVKEKRKDYHGNRYDAETEADKEEEE